MKKDTFIKGAMISTLCIVMSKILGIIYVIPFHAIIGPSGRALYGYAYNMYMLFLNFSTVGIPLAISKLVSEYHALGYEDAKKRTYRLAIRITFWMALLSTLVLFFGAPFIAKTILGGVQGGNTQEDITFVLRISSSAILFVTMLSGMRGYLQGHKYITPPSISQVIEQLVRVIVIIVGSFFAMKFFGTKEAVGIAVFGATVGAIAALFYLEKKMKEERKKEEQVEIKEEERKIANKTLVKQLLLYTIPFVVVSIAVSLYNTIDMLSIVRPLVQYGKFSAQDAETILSIISTWGAKLNVIVTSIAAGMVVSVLPNITSDYTKKKMKSVDHKINQTLQITLYFVLPMVVGLSFLAEPVWTIFYGKSSLGPKVFSYSILTALFYSLFLNIHTIMQSVDRHKTANLSIAVGLLTKLCLTVPLIILFSKTNWIPAFYGSITATILAYILPITISLIDLKKQRNISFKDTFQKGSFIFLSTLVMFLLLLLLKTFIPIKGGRIYACLVTVIYTTIGMVAYFFLTTKCKVFEGIFGCNFFQFVQAKWKRGKSK